MDARGFALALILTAGTIPAFAQDQVSITLGDTNTETGISLKEPDGAATTVVDAGGSKARSTTAPSGKTGGMMYFALDKSFAFEGSNQDVDITVEYFDQGTDHFSLQYDSITPDPEAVDPSVGDPAIIKDPLAGTSAPFIAKSDTKKWLKFTFHITDGFFGKRQPGSADLRINDLTLDVDGNPVDGEGPEMIRNVVVSKLDPDTFHIKFTKTPVKLDGVLDDAAWKEANYVFKVDRAAQDVIQPSKWTSTDDYSLDARFAYDNDYLYLSYDVNDDVPRINNDQPGSAYMGDAAEVYFGFDQSKPGRTAYIQAQDFQIIMSCGPNPTWGVYYNGGLIWQAPDDGSGTFQPQDNIKVVDRAKGYILEARIPWAMLKEGWETTADYDSGTPHKAPVPGKVGFNVFADDGDNPDAPSQEKAMSITGRPAAYNNPSAWTTVTVDPPAPAVALGDINADGKVNVADATLALRIAVGLLKPDDNQKAAGDVNKDGKVDLKDTTLILQVAVGVKKGF